MADKYLYPTASKWNGGHSSYNTPATDPHLVIDDPYDAIDDGDFALWANSDAELEVSSITAMEAALDIEQVELHVRYRLFTGTTLVFSLKSGASESVRISDSTVAGTWEDATSTMTTSPFTGKKWTVPELIGLKILVDGTGTSPAAYCRVSSVYLKVIYTPSGNQDEAERPSRELLLRRRQIPELMIDTPLSRLDIPMAGEFGLEHDRIPTPDGAGAGRANWSARRLVKIGQTISLATKRLMLRGLDVRDVRRYYWETAVSEEPPGQGIARVSRGGRVFARPTTVLVESGAAAAQGSTQIVQVASGEEAYDRRGIALQDGATNWQKQSSFKNGTGNTFTGWTLAGVGSNGSAITEETANLIFDTTLTARAIRFTAGDPIHAADLQATGLATDVFTPDSVVTLSIHHEDLSSAPVYYCLQRSIDSYYYDASTQTWAAAKTWNACDLSSTPDRHAVTVDVGSDFTTLTTILGIPTTGQAGQENIVYHVQIEEGFWATTPILTEASIAHRGADDFTIEDVVSRRVWPDVGYLWFRCVPMFNSADLPASGPLSERVLFEAYYDEDDFDRVSYVAGTGFRFQRSIGGVTTSATKSATLTLGTAVDVGCRWTGSDGELGKTPNSLTVIVDGVAGDDAVATGVPTKTDEATLRIGRTSAPEPDEFSDLLLWVEADAETGLSDGDTLSTWSDLSGNGNDLTATGTPSWEESEINGLPVIRFDGSTDYYSIPNLGMTAAHWFILARFPAVPAGYHALLGSGTANYSGEIHQVSTTILAYTGAGWITAGTIASGNWYLIELCRDASYGLSFLDGVHGGDGAMTGDYNKAMCLGSRAGGTFCAADVAGLLAFSRPLRFDESRGIQRRFAAKYSRTVLGSTHADAGRCGSAFLSHITIGPDCLTDAELGDMP